ncbi:MAG: UDP-N-acetylmuramate--alanine ligase [Microbacteriaceae bacterium]|nr:UDP-N-acetylmuramate--alanine ligase [Microbacteriaceae bacterium]
MTIKPDLTVPVPARLDRVHFVGVGGAGMSGIARLFLARGATVSGSDRSRNAAVDVLRDLGATITVGHDASSVGDVDAIVVTSALWPDNAELAEARRRGIPVLHRSQALKALVRGDRLVAVAGAHGKTTSTGMIATALDALGADPSFVNGGVLADLGVSSRIGKGDTFVIEADESDGSFLIYDTSVALITNVDPDHLDHYGSAEAFDDAFVAFADGASERAVVSADDPGARRVAARVTRTPLTTFGESAEADVRVTDITTDGGAACTLSAGGASVRVQLKVPGRHNAVNAAGAVAVLLALGHGLEASAAAVARFGGTGRRFEIKGIVDGVSVYDDYAHHPTEVAAALSAARTVVGEGRILAVHQPHLYSRTQAFAGEFASVLQQYADHTVVLDVDGAREDPVPGVTGAIVTDRFTDPTAVDYAPDWEKAAVLVASLARPGDFVITLGCGSVYRIVPQILDALASRDAHGIPSR